MKSIYQIPADLLWPTPEHGKPEPVVCSVFGCIKILSLYERLCGSLCFNHHELHQADPGDLLLPVADELSRLGLIREQVRRVPPEVSSFDHKEYAEFPLVDTPVWRTPDKSIKVSIWEDYGTGQLISFMGETFCLTGSINKILDTLHATTVREVSFLPFSCDTDTRYSKNRLKKGS